jgi:hypothetical protein
MLGWGSRARRRHRGPAEHGAERVRVSWADGAVRTPYIGYKHDGCQGRARWSAGAQRARWFVRIRVTWIVLWMGLCVPGSGCAGPDPGPRQFPPGVFPPPSGAGVGGMTSTAGAVGGEAGTAGAPVAGTAVPTAGTVGTSGAGAPQAGTGGEPSVREFDAGSDPNRNAVVAGSICQRLAEIQCAGQAYCCDNPAMDVDGCRQTTQSTCQTMAMADAIAGDPVSGFDPARAMIVFTELERLASTCDPAIAAYAESLDGIRSMFLGTRAARADCKPQSVLNRLQAAAALASCQDHRSQACLPSLTTWSCTAHAAQGGRCFTDVNCTAGLYCDNPNLSVSGGNCMQRKALGSPCELPNECESLYCVGQHCVAADQQTAYCLQ